MPVRMRLPWRLSHLQLVLKHALLICLLSLIGLVLCGPAVLFAQSDTTAVDESETRPITVVDEYEYVVQPGDTWSTVANRTGLTVSELQEANSQSLRRSGYLIVGERLTIPDRIATTTHVVQRGESWTIIAQEYGISYYLLKAVNPAASRYGDLLRRGETLTIPLLNEDITVVSTVSPDEPETTDEPAPEESAPDESAPEEAETPEVEPDVGAETTPETTEGSPEAATADATATSTGESTTEEATAEATDEVAAELPSCPTTIDAYPDQLVDLLNSSGGNAETLSTFLTDCGVIAAGSLTAQDLTGDGVDDFVIVYTDPAGTAEATGTAVQPSMDLLILNSGPSGYQIGHQARAESQVQLLSTTDLNNDGLTDVVWTETTCGASDCFQTLQVYSWDGTNWINWTAERVTMANAEIRLEDVDERGSGFELLLDGGVYTGEGAGPQRARQTVWGSVDGTPYTLLTETVAESNCLYHTVLDANEAFLNGGDDNFAEAEMLYSAAVADNTLESCGTRAAEEEELRSFSIYRLALIAAYRGEPMIAADLISGMGGSFPESVYYQVGLAWLPAYAMNYDIAEGCAAVQTFVQANPEAVAILADYGFANPTFTAEDVCPVLAVEVPPVELPPTEVPPTPTVAATAEPAAESGTETDVQTATDEANSATGETAESETGASETGESEANASEAGEGEAAESETDVAAAAPVTATAPLSQSAEVTGAADVASATELPGCPENLAGYASSMPIMLDIADGDELIVETWLRSCDAMSDERGSFQLTDLNDDGLEDAIFLPTIVSDLGFGRDGAQGAVLIYHGDGAGNYELVANPEIYGEPTLLTIGDLNDDRQTDIAWTIEGCSPSFCISEVKVVNWANGVYTPTIEPGATIAEGTARFEEVAAGNVSLGQQLVLEGGVSGTADGGLAVPHTEIWQSINRAPFQRVSWTYDRLVEGSDCMGLRLVEADVALQAADVIGYEPAIALYTESIDPTLEACSLYGMAAEEELQLLQGLASFRLIQAQALSGDLIAADETLAGLTQGLPESDYTRVADTWFTTYVESDDATAACDAVTDIIAENADLWRITDHYGYNHPALAAEQICFAP